MSSHDRFILASLALSTLACFGGSAAGAALVVGRGGVAIPLTCFGFIAIIAIPVGFLLAFTLMPSSIRWYWLICWSTALAAGFAIVGAYAAQVISV